MSYDVIQSIRQLKASGKGDTARLSYILDCLEKGRHLYLSDQRYIEGLLDTYRDIVKNPSIVDPYAYSNLGKDLREINERLEKFLQYRSIGEKRRMDSILTQKTNSTSSPSRIGGKVARPKSEDITLALSIVLGLISLQGIGHIYIGKIAKGVGILVASMTIFIVSISYFLGLVKNFIPPFLNDYLPFILFGIYFGPYILQIFDSRRLCIVYNAYVAENDATPPWW